TWRHQEGVLVTGVLFGVITGGSLLASGSSSRLLLRTQLRRVFVKTAMRTYHCLLLRCFHVQHHLSRRLKKSEDRRHPAHQSPYISSSAVSPTEPYQTSG
ncbi:hypothetical protein F5887DRAFT_966687, partial [Amanita rubescens]